MSEILKLSQEGDGEAKVVISGDDNHLFFQFGERLLITRKLTGNFPDYERVLPKDHHEVVTLQRDEIKSAVESIFQVKVDHVRTINFMGKMARRGRFEGRKPSWKKAYVTLKHGEKPVDYGEAI